MKTENSHQIKRVMILLTVIIVLGVDNFFAQAVKQPESKSVSLTKLYNDGLYEDIITSVTAKDSSARTSDDFYYLGQSYSALNDLSNAESSFKKAIEKDSTNRGFRLTLCRTLNQETKITEAIKNYKKLVEEDSTFTPAVSELGMIYISIKEYKNSIPLFKKLASLNSKDFKSSYYAAYTMFQNGLSESDTTQFLNYLFQSLHQNYHYIPTQELYGAFQLNLGNYNAAYYCYDEIARQRPNDPDVYYKAGICLEKMKLMVAAIIRFKKAVELDSTVFAYPSHLGFTYYVNGNVDSAIVAYKRALHLNKDNPTVYLNLGMAYMNLDSLAAAKMYFEKALQNSELDQIIMMQNQLAYIELKLNNAKEAKTYCEKVLLVDPKNVYAQFNLAKSLDLMGDKKAAASNYKKAIPMLENEDKLKKELDFSKQRLSELQRKDIQNEHR